MHRKKLPKNYVVYIISILLLQNAAVVINVSVDYVQKQCVFNLTVFRLEFLFWAKNEQSHTRMGKV